MTLDEIVARLRAAGGVGDWMACPEGGAEWSPLSANAEVMALLQPPPPATPRSPDAMPPVDFGPPPPVTPPFASPSPYAAQPAPGNDNTIPVLIHVGVLAGFVVPFGGLALPLILWLVNRQKPGVDAHGKEVMNWIIFLIIVTIPSLILMFCYIGFCLMGAIVIAQVVYAILGAIKASKGELQRYPMPFRLIK